MATSDPRPVTAPPASDLPDRPPPARPPVTTRPEPGAPILDEGHQLPVHKGKVGRVTDHVKGAADNLTDWFELRIALLKREVKDEIDTIKRQVQELAKAYGAVVALLLLVAFYGLLFLGFAFSALWGWLIGSDNELWALTLGFFTLTALFGLLALMAKKRADKKKASLSAFSKEGPEPVTGDTPPTNHAPPSTS